MRLGNILGIQQQDNSAAFATRIPFTNVPLEMELHGLLDFSGHGRHDLFACNAGFHGDDDHHPGGCGRWRLRLGEGWIGDGNSDYQSQGECQGEVTDCSRPNDPSAHSGSGHQRFLRVSPCLRGRDRVRERHPAHASCLASTSDVEAWAVVCTTDLFTYPVRK